MKSIHNVAFILTIIGGLNWLLIGLFDWGISDLFGYDSVLVKLIYILVGISAVYLIVTHKKTCKECATSPSVSSQM